MKLNRLITLVSIILLMVSATLFAQEGKSKRKSDVAKNISGNPVVVMETSLGTIEVELFADKAPITVKNFLSYVDDKHFNNTVFHRVIKNFMIQGGGFTASDPIKEKPTKPPIINESDNGLKNERGTLAMARTPNPNSATSQFFINVVNNDFLNRTERDAGYAVFGKVLRGIDIVDKIREVKTGNAPAIARSGNQEMQTTFQDVPQTKVVIKSVRRLTNKK